MENSESQVAARVMKVVSETLVIDKGKISRESRFVEDLGTDSLDKVTLVMALEDEFKTSITDEQAEGIISVKDVISALSCYPDIPK